MKDDDVNRRPNVHGGDPRQPKPLNDEREAYASKPAERSFHQSIDPTGHSKLLFSLCNNVTNARAAFTSSLAPSNSGSALSLGNPMREPQQAFCFVRFRSRGSSPSAEQHTDQVIAPVYLGSRGWEVVKMLPCPWHWSVATCK